MSDIELFFPRDMPGRRDRILQDFCEMQAILKEMEKTPL